MKRLREIKSVAFLLVVSLFLIGCEGQNEAETDSRTLTVGFEGDVVSMDPHASNVGNSIQVLVQVYEPLVRLDLDGNIVGVLAESWERYDDYSYTFYLREGVRFHNGEEMTAEDVAFSIRRGANSPVVSAFMGVFDPDNIEVIDTYTIRIGTREPFAPLLNNLTHPGGSILSLAAYEAGICFDEEPIGTGPFVVTHRVHGERIEFEAFEDFHGDQPAFDYLVIRFIVDLSARLIELESGAIDIANISRSDAARVENNPELTLHQRENQQMLYIGMNTERISDLRVRQAINYAIDVEEIHETLFYGLGNPITAPLSTIVPGARTDLEGFPFNPERARELLAEAGYADGLELTLVVNEFPDRQEWALAAQSYLAEVGVTVHITQVETAIFLEETEVGNYDLFVLAWTAGTGDADYGLYPLFHSTSRGGPGNRTFFSHPQVDELLDIGRTNFDPEVRSTAYHDVQEMIAEEAPMVFLVSGDTLVGTRSNVQGLDIRLTAIQLFYTVYFD